MQIADYPTAKLANCLKEYRGKLAVARTGDNRRKQTKLDIVFYGAMATLLETELCNRLPW